MRARTWHDELGRVENGSPARVVAVDADRVDLLLGDGRQASWTREQLNNADLRLAYVQHPWPAQGLTVDRLHYIHDELAAGRSTYVAATRARNEFHVYTARETLQELRDGRNELTDLDVLAESLGRADVQTPSIDLRRVRGADDRELEIAIESPTGRPAEPGVSCERDDVHIGDPLDEVRAALGSSLAARLCETPVPHGLRELTREQLQVLVDDHQAAVKRFPGRAALELRRLQRDREIAIGQRDAALRDVVELQRQRGELGRLKRDERAALDQRIQARQRSAQAAQRDIDRADRREEEIAAAGEHPIAWLTRDGQAATQWAHARHELDVRRELELKDATERAITDPPAHAQATLGERPDHGPERHRYDQLAGDLERYRLEHDIELEPYGSLGPRPAIRDTARDRLARRIYESRVARGLAGEPPGQDLHIEQDAIDLDV